MSGPTLASPARGKPVPAEASSSRSGLLRRRPAGIDGGAEPARPTRGADPVLATDRGPTGGVTWDFRTIPVFSPDRADGVPRPGLIQPKLAVGAVDDPLEREADAVADRVMGQPDLGPGLAASPPTISRKCAECEDDEEIQAKRAGADVGVAEAPPVVDQVLGSAGRPLDPATRAFFEPRFGADFSSVRVHTDAEASTSARSIGALAYASGRHLAFADGRFAPGTEDGRRLIAHELAHVVQQDGGSGGELRRLGDPDQVPMMLSCQQATSASPPPVDFLLFPNAVSTLTDDQKSRIAAFVDNRNNAAKGSSVRVDGYASRPGDQAMNWQLSCGRASAVKDELMNPSAGSGPGIPEGSIELFMNGETEEFGEEARNRRASLALDPPSPSLPPAPNRSIQPVTPPTSVVFTSDCDATQIGLIKDAIVAASSNIATVLPLLAANPLSADMQNALWLYFRDSSPATAATVSANLTKIKLALAGLTYECESDCDPNELGYTRLGAILTGLGNIHLCMNNLPQDAGSIADTMIHEAAHFTLSASDSAGYYGNDCEESETTVSAGSSTKLGLADSYNCFVKNWLKGNAADRANARGDLTGANIAGIVQSPAGTIDPDARRRSTLFSIKLTRGPLAIITGVSYRWVLRDTQGNTYRMTDTSGNDLFDLKPAVESVTAVLNTPTRDLLKQRGVISGTVFCRATSPLFADKVFNFPVNFVQPTPVTPSTNP